MAADLDSFVLPRQMWLVGIAIPRRYSRDVRAELEPGRLLDTAAQPPQSHWEFETDAMKIVESCLDRPSVELSQRSLKIPSAFQPLWVG